ncbi:DUF1648 domain-containing protein [Paenibacillus tarimensis]
MAEWSVWIILLVFIPVGVLLTVIPYLTRKIESFGVTIPEEAQQHPEIVAIRRQYVWINAVLGAAATLSALWFIRGAGDEETWAMLYVGHLLGYIFFSFAIYLKQHFTVKQLKSEQKWSQHAARHVIVDTKFRQSKLTVSNGWFLLHALIIAATLATGIIGYGSFPEHLPMKYGFDGEVTRSVDKSYPAVLWPVALQTFLLALFIFLNYVIGRSKQLVEPSDPEGSLRRNAVFRRRWSAFLTVLGFLTIGLIHFTQLSMLFEWSASVVLTVPMIFAGIVVVGSIALSVVTGQGGSRIRLPFANPNPAASIADQDQYWKLGIVYFNPGDPALFVEKRFGVGWTINMARPLAWIILLAIIAVPVVIAVAFNI